MNSFYSHRSVGSGSALVHTARQCRYATLIVVVGTVAIFGTYERSQSATIDNWKVNSGGSWNTGANWSTGSIPTIADDAIIGSIATSVTSPASITLDVIQTAYGLTLDPGGGRIDGTASADQICGRRGADEIHPGYGKDYVTAGAGPDVIYARDGYRDLISCGRGRDRVIADRKDRVSRSCERLRRGPPR